jgi:hypothetical protein
LEVRTGKCDAGWAVLKAIERLVEQGDISKRRTGLIQDGAGKSSSTLTPSRGSCFFFLRREREDGGLED